MEELVKLIKRETLEDMVISMCNKLQDISNSQDINGNYPSLPIWNSHTDYGNKVCKVLYNGETCFVYGAGNIPKALYD